jgi:hypothetical protein
MNKKRIFSEKHCKNISLAKKKLFKNKRNHPLYGKILEEFHGKNCLCSFCKAKKGLRNGINNPNFGKKVLLFHKENCQCICCKASRRELIGNKNPMYIDGRKVLSKCIRALPEAIEWKKFVFKKYNYKCIECGSTEKLEVHHKKLFTIILNEFLQYYYQFSAIEDKETLVRLAITWLDFWDIDNGEILCKLCHDNVNHTWKVNK